MQPGNNKGNSNYNEDVTRFLDGLNHPFRNEIDLLRQLILETGIGLSESIKWNGPNYAVNNQDRITMKIQPPVKIQLIFHRGAKAQEQPTNKLIADHSGLLTWKENDRAVATFYSAAEIESHRAALAQIVTDWIWATT
jgi:hypothetical protein